MTTDLQAQVTRTCTAEASTSLLVEEWLQVMLALKAGNSGFAGHDAFKRAASHRKRTTQMPQ